MELLLEFLLHGNTILLLGHLFWSHNGLEVEVVLEDEAGWHHVIVVDKLDEWLHSALSIRLLLAHSLGDLAWWTLDTNNESVGKLSLLHKHAKDQNQTRTRSNYLPCYHHRFA